MTVPDYARIKPPQQNADESILLSAREHAH
jgi:hypothetical protein